MSHKNYIYEQYKYELIHKLIDFCDIPEHYYTDELCKIAINDSLYYIRFIPEELRTKEIWEIVINKDGSYIQLLFEHLRTEDLCNLAVKTWPKAEQWAPPGTSVYNNYIMKKALL